MPPLWIRPPQVLSNAPGTHRFVWDLHYERPVGVRRGYPISAIPGRTPVEPRGPYALPGDYTVRLAVDCAVYPQPLRVKMDPRVTTDPEALRRAFDLSMRIREALGRLDETTRRLEAAGRPVPSDLPRVGRDLETLYRRLQESDQAPTPEVVRLTRERLAEVDRVTGG